MIATFEELEQANDTEYSEVKAYGKTIRLGSLNSGDMMDWVQSNEDEDTMGAPKRSQDAGLRLIVRSLVDKDGKRVPKEKFDAMVESFRNKSARSNGQVIAAALLLNGLNRAPAKNDSGEGVSGDSPTDSPSPQVM